METKLNLDWKVDYLGNHCHKPSYGYTASATDKPVGPKFLRITDIQDGSVNWERVPYCRLNKKIDEDRFLRSGDMVIARIGATTGKSFIIRDCPKAVFASYLICLRTKETLLSEYLNFFCQSNQYWKQVNQEKGGRLKGGVNIPILKNLKLPLPSVDEQHAIAKVLKAIQDTIEVRKKELELERERKAALMEYLFTHGTRKEPTKQTEIGEMPKSWNVKKLSELCDIRYGLGQPPKLDENGIPMIRATDIKRGKIISDGVLRIAANSIPGARNPYLKEGDILVVRSGAYTGDVAMYDGRWSVAIAGYDLVVSPSNGNLNSTFLSEYLLANSAQKYFKSNRDRSAQPHLNSEQLGNLLIPLPNFENQISISEILTLCNKKIDSLFNEAAFLNELFKSMLEKLMSGRISTLPLIEEKTSA